MSARGAAVALAAIAAVVSALATAPAVAVRLTARAARTIDGTDSAHLHLVHPGERLLEEGAAHGALRGQMRAELKIGPVYTGSFTISTDAGQIRGTGSATPHGAGRYQSFAGTLTIAGGSGRYAHARGHDKLYGVFDRRSYAVVVMTEGTFSY